MLPAELKVRWNDQADPDGLPLPPVSSQPLAQRKPPAPATTTLWKPPALVQRTVSPTAMLSVLGEYERPLPPTTTSKTAPWTGATRPKVEARARTESGRARRAGITSS